MNLFNVIREARGLAAALFKDFHTQQNRGSSTRWIIWHESGEDAAILNVDGSCLGNPGRAGFGGILRDGSGGWMGGFAGQLGVANNFTAELVALLRGLDFAWSKGVSDLICYSDSTSVIMAVLQSVAPAHSHAGLICSIQDRLCRPWRV